MCSCEGCNGSHCWGLAQEPRRWGYTGTKARATIACLTWQRAWPVRLRVSVPGEQLMQERTATGAAAVTPPRENVSTGQVVHARLPTVLLNVPGGQAPSSTMALPAHWKPRGQGSQSVDLGAGA